MAQQLALWLDYDEPPLLNNAGAAVAGSDTEQEENDAYVVLALPDGSFIGIKDGSLVSPNDTAEGREPTEIVPLLSYDTYIVAFSGGKDSIALVLWLLENGVPPERIELWHHDIDGREGSRLMDWPCMRDYCRAFAAAFNLRIYYSWKVGGFEREMLRENARTAPTRFETPDGTVVEVGGNRGKAGTRLRFPQVSADLSVRWCSAYLKIDVMSTSICNQPRFEGKRTLVLTGERAEESACRAKYNTFEPHRTDKRNSGRLARHVDHCRPIHRWTEEEVWAIIARWRVDPPVPYKLGWGRVSCSACIFGSNDQWASLQIVNPTQFNAVAGYERRFGCTIRRDISIEEAAAKGTPYAAITPELIALALSEVWTLPIILPEEVEWQLPAGAYGDSAGPI